MIQKTISERNKTVRHKPLAHLRLAPHRSLITVYCLLLTAFSLFLAACTDPDLVCNDALGCVRIGANAPIRLAAMLALSGSGSYLGQDSLRGVEIALAERDNLLLEHPLELTSLDTACSLEAGRAAAIEAEADPFLLGIVGDTCSAVSQAIIPTVQQAGLIMISPSSTGPNLPETDISPEGEWQMSFFRTVPNTLWQGEIAADFARNELGATTAAIIYDETEASAVLQQKFTDAFMTLGGRITFVGQVALGQTDVQEVTTAVNTGRPDLLYLPLFEPEANLIINVMAEESDLGLQLLGTDRLFSPNFAQNAGAAVQDMMLTGPTVAGAAYEDFLAQWLLSYGENPTTPYHAYAYDATIILLNAIETVAQVGRNGSLLIGRQALRQAVAETQFDGLTGPLACTTAECASPAAFGVYQLTRNQISGQDWPPPRLWPPPDSSQQ